jgi:heme/copper-type cytochrome/quinol oxidase subunit 4
MTSEHDPAIDDRLYSQLTTTLSVSSAMVGVCLTAISLLGVSKSLNKVETFIDDLIAGDAVIFMMCALLSFLGMRTKLATAWRGLAVTVDVVFCLGLIVTVFVAAMLAVVVL